MVRTKKHTIFTVFMVMLGLSVCLPPIYAQDKFREIIRQRIKKRLSTQTSLKYGSGDYDFSLVHDGLRRIYKVHVPPSYDKNNSLPVVLAFHGGGGNAEDSPKYFQLNGKSDEAGFIVVYPEGTGRLVGGKVLASWNAGKCCPPSIDNNVDDVGFIERMIEKLGSDFNIDKNRIYATGMSNGAQMVYRLACEIPDKIAAIAPVGAQGVFDACKPKKPVPIMHFHGTEDPCALYKGGTCGGCMEDFLAKLLGFEIKEYTWSCDSIPDYIRKWLNFNKLTDKGEVTYQKGKASCITYGKGTPAEIVLCSVEGMGHNWPGATTYGLKACKTNPDGYACSLWKKTVGPLSNDIIANDAMWEFFKRHPMKTGESDKLLNEYPKNRQKLQELLSLQLPPYHPEKLQVLEFGARKRTYLLHVPSCYKKGIPIPLVLAFHGGGGTGEAAEEQSGLSKKADEECFIVVYPDGASKFGIPGRRQYWASGTARTEVRSVRIDDVGFISALIDKLADQYTIDRKRIYATGLSNGAQMSYRLACELSSKIAAIAPIGAGMVVENCSPSRPVPIIHFHGTLDPGWPYYGGSGCFTKDVFPPVSDTINKWIALNKCSASAQITYQKGEAICKTYSSCADDTEVTLCTIEGGGHVWPGGYAFPSEENIPWDKDCALGQDGKGVGKITQDIVARDAMWEFFKRHPMTSEPTPPVNAACGNGVCEEGENDAICSKDCCEGNFHNLRESGEKDCLARDWRKLTVHVNGLPRKVMWKGPQGTWKNGAIIVMHGGGGDYSNYCGKVYTGDESADKLINGLNEPMVELTELAIKEGFAVFSLDSLYNLVTDPQGRPVGKRWDSLVQDGKQNIDLPFIEKVVTDTIPGLRPVNSAQEIFITGISNGGFMTILAATHFPDKITAFSPVSAGDPYGAYFDMGSHPKNERKCAPGVWRDNETKAGINEKNSCAASEYPDEKTWPAAEMPEKPVFKQFHHEGDAGCDISCMRKVRSLLTEHGYKGEEPFVIKKRFILGRSALNHFWQSEYNQPLIEFFKKHSMK